MSLNPKTLPGRYGKLFVEALPVDPERLFVFWEITPQALLDAEKGMSESERRSYRQTVKLLDVTDVLYDGTNAWHEFYHEIDAPVGSMYVVVQDPGRNYLVQLCCVTYGKSNDYVLCSSRPIEMPPSGPSDDFDEAWEALETDYLVVGDQGGEHPLGGSSEMMPRGI